MLLYVDSVYLEKKKKVTSTDMKSESQEQLKIAFPVEYPETFRRHFIAV